MPRDCFADNRGADYRGPMARTRGNTSCVSWLVALGSAKATCTVARESGIGNHNFCRNPEGTQPSAWPVLRLVPVGTL